MDDGKDPPCIRDTFRDVQRHMGASTWVKSVQKSVKITSRQRWTHVISGRLGDGDLAERGPGAWSWTESIPRAYALIRTVYARHVRVCVDIVSLRFRDKTMDGHGAFPAVWATVSVCKREGCKQGSFAGECDHNAPSWQVLCVSACLTNTVFLRQCQCTTVAGRSAAAKNEIDKNAVALGQVVRRAEDQDCTHGRVSGRGL